MTPKNDVGMIKALRGAGETGGSYLLALVVLLPLLLLELTVYFLLFLTLAVVTIFITDDQSDGGWNKEREPSSAEQAAAFRWLQRFRTKRSSGGRVSRVAMLQEVMSADLGGHLKETAANSLTQELVSEVCQSLEASNLNSKVLKELQRSFGESCLYLSGGGMLGMYHLGTVRRLLEEDLLPQHICGTSVGSIVGAFVCTRTDAELRKELEGLEEWYRQMGPLEGPFPVQYWEVVVRVLWRGYIYDYMNQYRNQATFVSHGLTFAEAYERTGRTFTITCAPVSGGPVVLLNRYTAPNVMIASAICASSSMPMLVEAVRLLEKTGLDGSLRPWPGATDLMRDGTMMADSPCEQLQQMLNVRWSIISQVNPHVVPFSLPFILAKRVSRFSGVFARSLSWTEGSLRRCIWSTLLAFQGWTNLPKEGSWISQLLFQDYFGHVNIIHYEMRFKDYLRLIKNETSLEDFRNKVSAAAACTEEQLPRYRLRKKVEASLELALQNCCDETDAAMPNAAILDRRFQGAKGAYHRRRGGAALRRSTRA